MDMLYSLVMGMVTQLGKFPESHGIVHIKLVTLVVCRLYLSKWFLKEVLGTVRTGQRGCDASWSLMTTVGREEGVRGGVQRVLKEWIRVWASSDRI